MLGQELQELLTGEMARGSAERGSAKMGEPVLCCVSPYEITPKK